MSALVYQKAFILTAGMDFNYSDQDPRRHVTNLSVNKRFANHPGQIPCDLIQEYPQVPPTLRTIGLPWYTEIETTFIIEYPHSSLATTILIAHTFSLGARAAPDYLAGRDRGGGAIHAAPSEPAAL